LIRGFCLTGLNPCELIKSERALDLLITKKPINRIVRSYGGSYIYFLNGLWWSRNSFISCC